MYNVSLTGALPLNPTYFFALMQKSKKKNQDCARFAQKTIARKAKILQTAPSGRQIGVFLTPFSLVFWLTERGQSLQLIDFLASVLLYNSF